MNLIWIIIIVVIIIIGIIWYWKSRKREVVVQRNVPNQNTPYPSNGMNVGFITLTPLSESIDASIDMNVINVYPEPNALDRLYAGGIKHYVMSGPIPYNVQEWFDKHNDVIMFYAPIDDFDSGILPSNIVSLPQTEYKRIVPEIVKMYPKVTLFINKRYGHLVSLIGKAKVVNFKGTNRTKVSKLISKMTKDTLCIPLLDNEEDLTSFRHIIDQSSGTPHILEVTNIKPNIIGHSLSGRYLWLCKHKRSLSLAKVITKGAGMTSHEIDLHNAFTLCKKKIQGKDWRYANGIEGPIFENVHEYMLFNWDGRQWIGNQFYGNSAIVGDFVAAL
ncbi:hypothetical protein D3C87_1053410 [compost metagenome]